MICATFVGVIFAVLYLVASNETHKQRLEYVDQQIDKSHALADELGRARERIRNA